MNLDQEKNIIDAIRKCQRNWDLSRDIPQDHIDHFISIAKTAPSKQDESYFNLYVITNKTLILELLDFTWGHTLELIPGLLTGVTRNTQMGANSYFLFTAKPPIDVREVENTGYNFRKADPRRKRNAYLSIGIASALIARSAAELGYKTGFNSNHAYHTEAPWREKLGIGEHEEIVVGLGVGFPQPERERNEHDETEFLIGEDKITRYNTNDSTVMINGQEHPMPQIVYRTYSQIQKDILIKKFD